MKKENNFTLSCPIPISQYPHVMMAHGGGGILMHNLIEKMFMPEFSKIDVKKRHDSAVLFIETHKIAFTTDSYVIKPLFFPGGDIGSLAIYGTVNDLSMSGAKPLFISVSFILEEGLPMETLWKIVSSMKDAAQKAKVDIVTGDTKVVDKGKGDGIFINTSGIGILNYELSINPGSVKSGDVIIVNGDLGRHGISIMAEREGLEFESTIESDSAPLNDLVQRLLKAGIEIHCMRDLTRGGLASSLVEIAEASNLGFMIDEQTIPVREDVKGACEILGFDPMYVANEGRFIIIIPEKEKEKTLEIMKKNTIGKESREIGKVNKENRGMVIMKSLIGATRIVDMLSGEQLPRIC